MNTILNSINPKNKEIIIYGAGGVARDLIVLLRSLESGLKLSVAVSNLEGNPKEILGIPVISLDSLSAADYEYMIIIATMPGIARGIEKNLKEKGFTNIHHIEELLDSLYEEIWKDPIDNHKAVFSHFGGIGYGGNGKYVSEELKKYSEKIDVVWGVKGRSEKKQDGIRFVEYGTYEYYRELGTARIWFDDQHKNYLSRKRDGQIYIQTWHGVGPIKKIEHDADNISSSYLELCDYNSDIEDYFVSASGFNSEQYRRAFHYYGEIIECGYPRNDILVNGRFDASRVRTAFDIADNKKVVLYAPTFREGDEVHRPDLKRITGTLAKRFGGEYVVLVRLHPNDKLTDDISFDDDIIDATGYPDVQELLCLADVLVTDYSSIMWDFSLQKKPVFLYHPNDRRYQEERGNYLRFSQMPYIEATDDEDLQDKICNFDFSAYREELEKFFTEYVSFDKGNAAAELSGMITDIISEKTSKCPT